MLQVLPSYHGSALDNKFVACTAYLDRELSADRLVGIGAANEKAIGPLSAKHPYVVLALVIVAALQVAKLPVRLGAGPLQSLKQPRPDKH